MPYADACFLSVFSDLFVGHLGRKDIDSGAGNIQWYKRRGAFLCIGSRFEDTDVRFVLFGWLVTNGVRAMSTQEQSGIFSSSLQWTTESVSAVELQKALGR